MAAAAAAMAKMAAATTQEQQEHQQQKTLRLLLFSLHTNSSKLLCVCLCVCEFVFGSNFGPFFNTLSNDRRLWRFFNCDRYSLPINFIVFIFSVFAQVCDFPCHRIYFAKLARN
jgi:hypothetical protein